MNEIKIENLTIGYHSKIVAKGLTTTLSSGALTCLIGKNGLGKSTLLKVLAGFIPPLSGKVIITFDGKDYDLSRMSKMALSHLIAVVLTDKVDIANVSVKDVVSMGRMPYTNFFGNLNKDDEEIVLKALNMTGISDFASRDISTLSDGERQKVMIARALAQQTPIILLDEPTAFLDYESKVETMRLLHNMASNMDKIVLASTHDLDIAVRIADRMITIDNGIKDVVTDPRVSLFKD